MRFVSKSLKSFLCYALLITLSNCGVFKAKSSDDDAAPQANQSHNDDSKQTGGDETKSLALGEESSAKGDVVKDDNGMYSLAKTYSFKLGKETQLQVRKSLSNGNCGSAAANFIVLKGEEQVASANIDPNKEYNGVPVEKLSTPLQAGDYVLVAFITLEQECKDMLFYYDFYVEEAKN